MKIYSTDRKEITTDALLEEYRGAHEVGVVRVGSSSLFFRSKLKQYAVPFSDIRRCYRRVMAVPAKMCCGSGEFEIENLVIESEQGEIAQIQLPGKKAAQILIAELREKMPQADFSAPKRDENGQLIPEGAV